MHGHSGGVGSDVVSGATRHGAYGPIQVNADGTYIYTLTSRVPSRRVNNGTDTVNAVESFTYMVNDASNNTATGTITINVIDDVPSVTAEPRGDGGGGRDPGPGGAAIFCTGRSSMATTDVAALSISQAVRAAVLVTGGAFGADGPAAALHELCADGDQCDVGADADRRHGDHAVAGRREGDRHGGHRCGQSGLTGKVAFAIAIDPLTGEVYVAQYLSLHQDSLTTTPNDFLSLAAGSVGVTVTLTDGDGDQVASTATDIGTHISFFDDGPTLPTVAASSATIGVDETPGVQTIVGRPVPARPILRARLRSRLAARRPRLRECLRALSMRAPIPMFPRLRWTMAR